GSGQDLQVNNINLRFEPPQPYATVRVTFGEFGGNVNLRINDGQIQNVGDFSALDGQVVGGVRIGVDVQAEGRRGLLRLDAEGNAQITSFAIGGQELWIDDVIFRGAGE